MRRSWSQQQGMVLVLTAVAITTLLGIAALAIDAAYLMELKAELQNAADAVSLAATSGLAVDEPTARQRAQAYAQLNRVLNQPITIDQREVTFGQWDFTTSKFLEFTAAPNSVRVSVRLTDTANSTSLFFAPMLGTKNADVMATATASLGSRNIVLALDRSSSMDRDPVPPGQPLQPITATKEAAKDFLDLLRRFPITGDKMGLVYYATQATVDAQLTENVQSVKQAIDQRTAAPADSSGCTNIADALRTAGGEVGSSRANRRGLKVVVLLSDGVTNTRIFGNTTPCEDLGTASPNESEKQAMDQATALANAGVVLYTISLGVQTNQGFMNKMAVKTGGEHFFSPTTKQLDKIFATISARIPVVLVE